MTFGIIVALIIVIAAISLVYLKNSKKSNKKNLKKRNKDDIPAPHSKPNTIFKIVTVIDGDTYMLRTPDDRTIKVRAIGVDSPESHKSDHKDIQYYGVEAAEYATKALLKRDVRIEYDVQTLDQHGRHLAYIYYLENNLFWNEHLVAKGYAKAITFNPNVKYQSKLQNAEKIARDKKLGLWNKGNN